jgi:hypothetical protein
MISSPCKTCHRHDQPKEDCYKDCPLLQAIQTIQMSTKEDSQESGVDYTEENRLAIDHSSAKYLLPSS